MISEVKNMDCLEYMKGFPDKKKGQGNHNPKPKKYATKKEKISAKNKRYKERDPERHRSYQANYRTKNPRGIFDVIKQSAKKRNLPVEMSRADFISWYNEQVRICIYCERTEEDVVSDLDIIQRIAKRLSIDRLRNEEGYKIDNLGLCCRRCNTIKGNFFTADEMFEIGKIISKKYQNVHIHS